MMHHNSAVPVKAHISQYKLALLVLTTIEPLWVEALFIITYNNHVTSAPYLM